MQGGDIGGEHLKVLFEFDLSTHGIVEFDESRKYEEDSDDDFGNLGNAFHYTN